MIWVLAAMLMLQAPGATFYSKQVVDKGDPPPCDNPNSLMCKPPKWSKYHVAYVITEQWAAGLKRYLTISKALDAEAASIPVKDRREVLRYAVTIFFYESGFREDVHSGKGPESRGDCMWSGGGPGKGIRLEHTCRSHCLGQHLIPRGKGETDNGYRAKDLVGTDLAATRRCAETTTLRIARELKHCGKDSPYCVFGRYGGVRDPRKHSGIKARVSTYYRLGSDPPKLSKRVTEELGL